MRPDDGRVVSNFIVQALSNKPITIYGTGEQTRSFCYVDDLISGILTLFFDSEIHSPINMGNPSPIDMLQLAKEIIALTNSNSAIEFLPLPQDDPVQREPDISLAKKNLNWEPKVDRMSGLAKTIEYFTNHR